MSGIGLYSLAEAPDGSRNDTLLDEGDACVFALETAGDDAAESRALVSAMLIVRRRGSGAAVTLRIARGTSIRCDRGSNRPWKLQRG